MKHYCPKSGLVWHSSLTYGVSQQEHPIFTLSYAALLESINKFIHAPDGISEQYSSPTIQDTYYLYGCALIGQFPVIWNSPIDHKVAIPVILKEWDNLMATAGRLSPVEREPGNTYLPSYRIDKHTCSLSTLHEYIKAVCEARNQQAETLKQAALSRHLLRQEETLARLLNNPTTRSRNALAKILPEWASIAADFPRVMSPVSAYTDEQLPLAEIWKQILHYSVLEDYSTLLTGYRIADVEELVIHCEENLELGTPYATYTLRALRKVITTLADFSWDGSRDTKQDMSLLDLDVLLDETLDELEAKLDGVGTTELLVTPPEVALSSPPLGAKKPVRGDYPNIKSYLAAVLAWRAQV